MFTIGPYPSRKQTPPACQRLNYWQFCIILAQYIPSPKPAVYTREQNVPKCACRLAPAVAAGTDHRAAPGARLTG